MNWKPSRHTLLSLLGNFCCHWTLSIKSAVFLLERIPHRVKRGCLPKETNQTWVLIQRVKLAVPYIDFLNWKDILYYKATCFERELTRGLLLSISINWPPTSNGLENCPNLKVVSNTMTTSYRPCMPVHITCLTAGEALNKNFWSYSYVSTFSCHSTDSEQRPRRV